MARATTVNASGSGGSRGAAGAGGTVGANGSGGAAKGSSARRDEILVIAARLFARKGIAGATVRDIADEAGILSGSLYHHFGSKDEIVAELLLPRLQRSNAVYREIVARGADPVTTLQELLRASVRFSAEGPDVARIVHAEARTLRENEALAPVQAARMASRKLWVTLVRRGIREGVFRRDVNPDVVVRAMFDATLSSTRWLPPDGRSTPQAVGDQLTRLFLGGLVAPPSPTPPPAD